MIYNTVKADKEIKRLQAEIAALKASMVQPTTKTVEDLKKSIVEPKANSILEQFKQLKGSEAHEFYQKNKAVLLDGKQ